MGRNVFNYFAFVYFTGKNEVNLVDDSMEQKLHFLISNITPFTFATKY